MAAVDEEFLRRLRAAFKEEADEHVQAMGAGLIELEGGVAPERQGPLIETIYREAHSLKGAARAVNMAEIETVCQALEDVFSGWKKKELPVAPTQFDPLQRAVNLVAALLLSPGGQAGQIFAVTQQLAQLRQGGAPAPAPRKTAPLVPLTVRPAEPSAAPAVTPVAPVPAPPEPPPRLPAAGAPMAETVRISTAKLDAILFQAEEMLIVKLTATQRAAELRALGAELARVKSEWSKAEPDVRQLRREGGGSPAAANVTSFLDAHLSLLKGFEGKLQALEQMAERDERMLGSLVDDLLENAKRLVMLPFTRVLEGFPRLVRELARDEGKDVLFAMYGQEIEIDKRILEEMKDPLIHILRNCVDHGIEMPAERGTKPARATIELHVAQVSAREVEICITDDGRGIDVAEVKAVAVRKGLVSAEDAERMDEQQALSLIFQSDISTSPIITEISGRGLGLAIVREKVQKLAGRLTLQTRPGQGTTFRIALPLTLATLRGLLVRVAEQLFVVPMTHLDRVIRIPSEEVQTVENRDTIPLDGRVLPFVRLDDVLELPRRPDAAPAQGEPRRKIFHEALVLGAADERIAFRVDQISTEQEVLVKPLARPLVRVRNIAGATVLADGKPVPILHVPDLLKSAVRASSGIVAPEAAKAAKSAKRVAVLVAEDSITSRALIKNILESAGYPVTTAVDGLEALATLRAGEFGLVVSDVDMPRMDGFGLTAAIRRDARMANVPVVLVTARETREDRERGIDAGANAYIVKSSFDQSDLLNVVRRLI